MHINTWPFISSLRISYSVFWLYSLLSPTLLRITLPLCTSNLVSFLFSIPICAAQIFLAVLLSTGEWLAYQGILRENCLSFFQQLTMVRGGIVCSSPFSMLGFGLAWFAKVLYILSQLLRVHMCGCPVVSRSFFLVVTHYLWHLDVFLPSVPQWILNLWDVVCLFPSGLSILQFHIFCLLASCGSLWATQWSIASSSFSDEGIEIHCTMYLYVTISSLKSQFNTEFF